MVTEWISCKERLPEQDQHVLCACIGEDEPIYCRHIGAGVFKCHGEAWTGYLDDNDITHWMALPSLPVERR